MMLKLKHRILILLYWCFLQSYSQDSTFIKTKISKNEKSSNVYLNEEPASINFTYLKTKCRVIEKKIGFKIEHQLDALKNQYENRYKDSLWVEDHNVTGIYAISSDSCRTIIQSNDILYINKRWSKRKQKRKRKQFLKQHKKVVYRYSFPLWLNVETCVFMSSYSKGGLNSGECMELYQWSKLLNQFELIERMNCSKS